MRKQSIFMREKKIYCGDNYREVDIYQYTKSQEEAMRGKRSKKEKVTAPKQKNLNDKNAKRYLIQLAKANFGENDFHVSCTYSETNRPKTIEEALIIVKNFRRRISDRYKKKGEKLKYILITEHSGIDKSGDIKHIHHHIIINNIGISRDEIEDQWIIKKKGEKDKRLGFINIDRIQSEEGGISALCTYLSKDPQGKKRWSTSQNLDRPESRTNDTKYSRRQVIKIATAPPDYKIWEKIYPGWELDNKDYGYETKYNDITGWSIHLKLRRKE